MDLNGLHLSVAQRKSRAEVMCGRPGHPLYINFGFITYERRGAKTLMRTVTIVLTV